MPAPVWVVIGAATCMSVGLGLADSAGQPSTAADAVVVNALTLRAEGKPGDAVTLLERFVATNPGDAGVHLQLALACADLGRAESGSESAATPAQQRALQQAATHFERVLSLTPTDTDLRYGVLDQLARLHTADSLNRPADAERYARRMIQADATRIGAYALLSQLFESQSRYDAAADVLRAARSAVPDMPAMFQLRFAQFLIQQVTEAPALPAAAAGKLLDEARAVLDALIEQKQEVRFALMAKSMALKVQAERVETRADRRKALLAESDAIYERSRSVAHDGSPAVRSLDEEWRDAQAEALSGGPGAPEDGRVYEAFVAKHPDFAPARAALGRWMVSQAKESTGRDAKAMAARTRLLESAVTHLRRVDDTAPEDTDRTAALADLIMALGPSGLNRSAEAVSVAKAGLARSPDDTLLEMRLLETLLPSPSAATDAALREARGATPQSADMQQMLGMYLWNLASDKKEPVSPDLARRLLAEAVVALDTALTLNADHAYAMTCKSLVLRQQAGFETDAARARVLLAEADRLRLRATQLMAERQKK